MTKSAGNWVFGHIYWRNIHFLCSILKKILKGHSLWVQALKKGEKQQVLGLLYHNIYRIQKINFQWNLYLHKFIFLLLSPGKKAKTISLKVFKTFKWLLKTDNKRLQKVLWDIILKIKLCGKRLYPTESVKYLGVNIDTKLSWKYLMIFTLNWI